MSREIRFPAAAIAALNKGNRIEAIKLVREANHGVDLRGAMEAVDAHTSGEQRFQVDAHVAPVALPLNGLPTEAIAAIARGQVLEAIKIVRQATGLGLKEAKDLVDGHRSGSDAGRDDKLEEIARKHGVEISPAAVAALNRGNVVEAIKLVRQENRIGLKEARDLLQSQTGATSDNAARRAPTVSMDSGGSRLWLAVLVVMGLAVIFYYVMGRG